MATSEPVAETPPQALSAPKSKMVQPSGLEVDKYYNPDRLNAMISFARNIIQSKAAIGGIANEYQALVIMQHGVEMGMAPMEALNSLYIVHGKVTIYGAAMTKQLRKQGWKIEYVDEKKGESVTVRITKGDESYSYTADKTDPILQKSQAMKIDPYSKLRWHALARCLRFNAADAMDSVYQIKEDLEDVEVSIKDDSKSTNPISAKTTVAKKSFDKVVDAVENWESTEEPLPETKEEDVETANPTSSTIPATPQF